MKKLLSYLLVVLCLSALLTTSALAATVPMMDFDLSVDGSNNVTVQTGDVITVTLIQTCSADAKVITEDDRVFFDHTFFEFVEGSNTTAVLIVIIILLIIIIALLVVAVMYLKKQTPTQKNGETTTLPAETPCERENDLS